MHSLEEYCSLFDLIWWKCGVPFFRVPGYDLGSTLNLQFPILIYIYLFILTYFFINTHLCISALNNVAVFRGTGPPELNVFCT